MFCNVLLGNLRSCSFMLMPHDTCHTPPIRTQSWTKCTLLMGMATPQCQCPPWQNTTSLHTTKPAQQQNKKLNKESRVDWASAGMYKNKSDSWTPHPTQRTGNQRIHYHCSGARHHGSAPEVSWPCLSKSELFWLHKENRLNIKYVV